MEQVIKILVVDDEQIVLDSIKKHLRGEANYVVHTFLSVKDALEFIDKEKVDLVLTDLMIPDMDGLEFLKLLKDKDESILAIMITGYATINTALQAMQLGAFDYLAKPFTKEELKSIVKRAADVISSARESNLSKVSLREREEKLTRSIKGIGENSWFMREEDGTVLLGAERAFVISLGRVQTVYLPSVGDLIRQGSVYFQAFSADLRSQSLLSPLSGVVREVNQNVLNEPYRYLQDPYNTGWLMRLEPTNFEEEIKLLGL